MLKAVLFDFDGVIVHSEPIHMETFLEMLKPFGVTMTEERWYKEFAGTGSGRIFKALIEEYNVDANVEELVEKRRDLFLSHVKNGELKEIPGLKQFLEYLRNKDIKMAIVSGGHRNYIEELNKSLGIEDYFDFIVTAEDISARKPDPEPFLYAARYLDINPEDCLVIEDSYAGCKAARNGNMKIVWMRPHDSMKAPDCDFEVTDFLDNRLKKLFED